MDVSILIVNYNSFKLILQCIESIYQLTKGISYEIIVVDNNAPERDIDAINESYSDIIYLRNLENHGFGSGNNFGAKYAKGKYLFFLNPDTILLNNAIYQFYDYCEKNRGIGIVGGNLYDSNLQPAFSCWSFLPGLLAEIDYLMLHKVGKLFRCVGDFNYSSLPKEVGYISGADLFISKAIFDKVQGFDEDFFMYYEETELTSRVKKLGYKVMSLPYAKIIHLEGQSESSSEKVTARMRESEKLYYIKTGQKYLIKLSYIVDVLLHYMFILFHSLKQNKDRVHFYNSKLKLIKRIEGK